MNAPTPRRGSGSGAGIRGRQRAGLHPWAGRTSLGAAVAMASLVLAACGGGGSSGGGAGGGSQGGGAATLTFINAQDPGTFDKVIAGFNKQYPNIKIKLQTVPFDDLNSTVQSRLGSKDPSIDLYDVDEPRLAGFAARGFLADLSDLGKEGEGKIDPKALQATAYQGKQYAMPRWTSTQLLYYNKAVLAKAGVPVPSSDPKNAITWEDIAAQGKKAQAAGAKWGFTFDQVDRYYQLQPLPESLGAGPGLKGQGLLTPDVTNAGWVKAFSWYGSTFRDGLSPRGVPPEETTALFGQGSTAFFAGGPWNAPTLDKIKGLDYGVAAYPKFAGGKAVSSTGSWSIGISPFSKNQDAAKKFIRYMTVDPTGAFEASSRNIPVQKDAFQKYLAELRTQSKQGGPLVTIIQNELASNAVARPTTTGYVDFENVMNKTFADIRNGADAAQRLQQASQELERVLAKFRQ